MVAGTLDGDQVGHGSHGFCHFRGAGTLHSRGFEDDANIGTDFARGQCYAARNAQAILLVIFLALAEGSDRFDVGFAEQCADLRLALLPGERVGGCGGGEFSDNH